MRKIRRKRQGKWKPYSASLTSITPRRLLKRAGQVLDVVVARMNDDGRQISWHYLFSTINARFWFSPLRPHYAWKNNPGDPDYNPHIGVLHREIAGHVVRVSIGLPKDRFTRACAVVALSD